MPEPGDRRALIEGLAVVAVTTAEMGGDQRAIMQAVGPRMMLFDLVAAQDARDIAEAIRHLPQPPDESAERRERHRPIEEMLGVTSPEAQLNASLTAMDALNTFALELEHNQDQA